jgi:hypothetical protein
MKIVNGLCILVDTITTEEGDNSPAQIGIPEIIKDGYISGYYSKWTW